MLDIHSGDNLVVLGRMADASFDLVYIDPPFNTGRRQKRTQLRTVRDEAGDRTGFAGRRYRSIEVGERAFADAFDDYLAFLEPRLVHARRVLKPTGSFFLHIDCREAHYCKVLLDTIFGRASFMNEIVWAYDYGARSRSRWSQKHDTIFWYAVDPKHYTFRYDDIDRIPYMAPELVGPAKAARGKTPTDTWWNTIVSPNGKEKTGYPTQKPLAIVERIVRVHSNPGDRLLDFFAGSGTLGAAATKFGRDAVLVDDNRQAIVVMKKRFGAIEDVRWLDERATKRALDRLKAAVKTPTKKTTERTTKKPAKTRAKMTAIVTAKTGVKLSAKSQSGLNRVMKPSVKPKRVVVAARGSTAKTAAQAKSASTKSPRKHARRRVQLRHIAVKHA